MRLLRLDDLMTSYTNARPGAGLVVVDLDLGSASGRLGAAASPTSRTCYTSSMVLEPVKGIPSRNPIKRIPGERGSERIFKT